MAARPGIVASPLRWVNHVLRRYDPDRRPRLAAWTWAVVAAIIIAFGVLGYTIPALIALLV